MCFSHKILSASPILRTPRPNFMKYKRETRNISININTDTQKLPEKINYSRNGQETKALTTALDFFPNPLILKDYLNYRRNSFKLR